MLDFDYLLGALADFSPTVILPTDAVPFAVCLEGGEARSFEPSARLIRISVGDVPPERLEALRETVLFVIGGGDDAPYLAAGAPAVRFPAQTPVRELYDRASEALADLGRLHRARRKMYDALESHKGLDALLKIAEEAFGNPVAIFDISSRLIACGEAYAVDNSDAAWQDYKAHGSISPEFAQKFSYDELFTRVMESTDPFFFDLSDRGLTKRLLCRIFIGGVSVGHCTVLERDAPFTELDVEIMRSFASVIGVLLERGSYLPYKNTVDGLILQELYSGAIAGKPAFLKRAAPFKWTMQQYWIVINIFIGEKRRSSLNLSTIFLDSLTQTLPREKCTVHFLSEDERVIALLNTAQDGVGELLAELDAFLQKEGMIGTVSRSFTDVMEFRRHVDFTEALIETALISGRHCGLFNGDDLFFENAAFVLDRYSDLQCHCLSELIAVRRRDAEEGTDYYNTIRVYLESGLSATQCAERLYMHRNTIIRRVERFCQLTGLDLSGEDVYKLYFSYKLLEYRDLVGSAPHDLKNTRKPGAGPAR